MKLELIEDGVLDAPLLLFHQSTQEEAVRLLRWITSAIGIDAAISTLGWIERVGLTDLVLRTSRRSRGVRRTGRGVYRWEMSRAGWEQVTGLLEPFIQEPGGWQFLSAEGELRVIFSPSGQW